MFALRYQNVQNILKLIFVNIWMQNIFTNTKWQPNRKMLGRVNRAWRGLEKHFKIARKTWERKTQPAPGAEELGGEKRVNWVIFQTRLCPRTPPTHITGDFSVNSNCVCRDETFLRIMLKYFPRPRLPDGLPHQVKSIYFVWVRVKSRVMGETNVWEI